LESTKKCAESRQLHNEGCSREVRVEPRGNVGVHSISSKLDKGRNGDNEYPRGLLEKILHRDNMNLANKRVKRNKGSHGVDGMSVNELLQFLKQNGNQIRKASDAEVLNNKQSDINCLFPPGKRTRSGDNTGLLARVAGVPLHL